MNPRSSKVLISASSLPDRFFLVFLLAVISLGLGSATAHSASQADLTPRCLDENIARSEVLSRFHFDYQDPELYLDLCDEDNLPRRVIESILYMKNLPNVSESADAFDQDKLSPNPFRFFASRIQTVAFDNTCPDSVEAYADSAPLHNGVIHICPSAANDSILNLSSTLLHESRHQDGFPHVICDHGDLIGDAEGGGGCDASYAEGGSYGIEAEYLVKLSRSRPLPLADRQDARATALEDFVGRFNELPLGIRRGVALVSDNNDVEFYDRRILAPLFHLESPAQKLIVENNLLRSFNPVTHDFDIYPDGRASYLSYKADISQLGKSPDQLVDIYSNISVTCFLFTDEVLCPDIYGPGYSIQESITSFTPHGFLIHDPAPGSSKTLYIVSTSGDLYTLSVDPNADAPPDLKGPLRFKALGAEILDPETWLFLSPGGRVRIGPANDLSKAVLAPAIDSQQRFKTMIAPIYWSETLQKL